MATKLASDADIAAAEQRWPRDVPDDAHVKSIMQDTGLSEDTARLMLAICRGDSEGDVIEVDSAELA